MIDRINFLNLGFVALALWAIYVTVEGLRHLGWLKGEYGRKAIHISTGILLASLPTFMSRTEIAVVNASFFLGLVGISLFLRYVVSHKVFQGDKMPIVLLPVVKLLKSIRAYEHVGRWSIGQFLYPLSLLLVVFMFEDPIIYAFAVLELALADGLAAVFGQLLGKKRYYIPGGYKTWVGSTAFFAVSVTLLSTYVLINHSLSVDSLILIVGGSMILTFIEGIISAGFDNLAVPFFMALLLQTLD